MAFPVVASSNTSSATSTNTVTVTKPTGLAAGDYMVAGVYIGSQAVTHNTPSGWTNLGTYAQGNRILAVHAKVADSGDAAASNFSFTVSGTTDGLVAILARVTGLGILKSIEGDNDNVAGTSASFVANSTPQFSDTLALMFIAGSGDTNVPTISGYASTPSSTWNEVTEVNVNTGTEDPSIGLAYSNLSGTSQITAYSATFSTSVGVHVGSLILLSPVRNETADISHLSVTPTLFGVTASQVNVTTDIGHNVITPTLNGIESEVSSDRTQWTPNNKNTTIWTPNSK